MEKFNMHAAPLRRATRLFLLGIALLLAACSSLQLAYNHGDTLLYWWLDGYVDLDSDQKPWVRQDIDDFFQWHRKTQLRDYAQVLQTARRQLQGSPTEADLLADYDDIRARTELMLLKALPQLAELARSLRPQQIEQMEKKFASNNDTFRHKNMKGDREHQLAFRYDKAMDQFELWFGNFSREQEAAIRQASDARPLNNALWLDERIRRQQAILALVRRVQRDKLGQDATMALIRSLIEENFARRGQSDRKDFFGEYDQGTAQLVLTVIQLATPAQKAHALKRMQGWIDDCNALAAQAH
ncbi:hypothetical protein H3H36_05505 [Duganella sp. FT3S]|uniref:Lipoprotein n=1 Tax=Rugamonas fusca TaxID=2758568 RepID=A0A7W2EF74_9BURK|nr:DUF6279 family lipoprotein [Rugamonas fusca]MBA5604816.1 hypothetical protein [Rugamonas fusca]